MRTCQQIKCIKDATHTVYWPGQTTVQCYEHAYQLRNFGATMRIGVPCVPIPEEQDNPHTKGETMNPILYERNGNRMFTDARTNDAINDALDAVTGLRGLAVVAHQVFTATESVTKLSVVYRDANRFTVVAAAFKDWKGGDLGVEAKVVWIP